MKTILASWILLAVPLGTLAGEVRVGEALLEIPAPRASVALDTENGRSVLDVSPQQELLAAFVSRERETRVPSHRFLVHVDRNLVDVSMSTADFLSFRDFVRKKNDEFAQEVRARNSDRMTPFSIQEPIDDSDLEAVLSTLETLPFPAHAATDRTLAFSYVQRPDSEAVEQAPAQPSAVTVTLVHVRTKLLMLHVLAQASELEWTRQEAGRWAATILSANPADAATRALEAAPPSEPLFDVRPIAPGRLPPDPSPAKWGSALFFTGSIVGIIVLLAWAVRRWNARASS